MRPEELEQRLNSNFPGADILVTDLTGTEDHYEVRIIAPQFEGMNRIQQHKAVMAAVDAELKSGELHALSLKTMAK